MKFQVISLLTITTLYLITPTYSSQDISQSAQLENKKHPVESMFETANPELPSNRYKELERTYPGQEGDFLRVKRGSEGEKTTINAGATDELRGDRIGKVKKRSYRYRGNVRRAVPVSIYEASSLWKPSTYQISRPYYIPVYGLDNQQHPIFYPPQPIHRNPGAPKDNPLKPAYVGPSYLPPTRSTDKPETMTIKDKFGEDDDDDAPIWGDGNMGMVPLRGDDSDEEEENIIPTRPPAIGPPTFPPLARPSSNRPGPSSNRPANNVNRPNFEVNRPGAARPPPPTRPSPTRPTPTRTTPRRVTPGRVTPSRATTARSPSSGPNNCVWAIISCCSVDNPSAVPEACFEQRGCGGPFWGPSPCSSEFARTAIESAIKYYNEGGAP